MQNSEVTKICPTMASDYSKMFINIGVNMWAQILIAYSIGFLTLEMSDDDFELEYFR